MHRIKPQFALSAVYEIQGRPEVKETSCRDHFLNFHSCWHIGGALLKMFGITLLPYAVHVNTLWPQRTNAAVFVIGNLVLSSSRPALDFHWYGSSFGPALLFHLHCIQTTKFRRNLQPLGEKNTNKQCSVIVKVVFHFSVHKAFKMGLYLFTTYVCCPMSKFSTSLQPFLFMLMYFGWLVIPGKSLAAGPF